jgi:multidrug resistance efflux pump
MRAVASRYVVPIVPWGQGPIVDSPAKPNVPIKKGDVLFEIDPTSYQYTVNQARAALQVARSDEVSFAAGVKVAEANIAKVEADARAVSGTLPSASKIGSHGIPAVKISLNDEEETSGLELGTAGSLAIYTDSLKPIHIMSRVTMRMNKWLYFLPFM